MMAVLPIAKSSLGVGITALSVSMTPIASAMLALTPAFEKARSAAMSCDARYRPSCAAAGAAKKMEAAATIDGSLKIIGAVCRQNCVKGSPASTNARGTRRRLGGRYLLGDAAPGHLGRTRRQSMVELTKPHRSPGVRHIPTTLST